jgi:hypothetical protein
VVGRAFAPLPLLSVAAGVTTIEFQQSIAADEPLRAGRYAQPVTFSVSIAGP